MAGYEFSEAEVTAITSKFPKLKYVSTGLWKGEIDFDKAYRDYRIIGSYEVAIDVPEAFPAVFPTAFDLAHRAKAIAKKHNIKDLRDLHCNPGTESVCLCVKQEEKIKLPPGSDLIYFIDTLVTPYFYALNFRDEQGYWPWKEYGHGGLGMLEFYASDPSERAPETIEVLAANFREDNNWKKYRDHLLHPKPKRLCPCGSEKTFPACHIQAWEGLAKMRTDLRSLRLDTYKLFTRRPKR